MQLRILDVISVPGGSANEDRAGFHGSCAWVIDGATDVIDAPLTDAASDAAWFAAALNDEVGAWAKSSATRPCPSSRTFSPRPSMRGFRKSAKRAPLSPDEQPSAAAMIVRFGEAGISYVTLGDCALIVQTDNGLVHVGDDEEKAGDQWVAKAIEEERVRASRPTLHSPCANRFGHAFETPAAR